MTQTNNFSILFTSAMPSGYGHYKISVELMDEKNRCKTFTATTTRLDTIDEAKNLLDIGEISLTEKNQLFFEAIESSIDGSLNEWLNEDIED